MALADVYDALRSDRCYRKGMNHDQARTIILEGDGKHFDPEVVMAFLRIEVVFAGTDCNNTKATGRTV